eukprot:1168141-Prorocentrum_lima.AAC.1
MSPTVTGRVRAIDNTVILAASSKAMLTCASFSKTVFWVTRNAPKSHADHHWMPAGRVTVRIVCGQYW